jgi:hypothetical protein
MRSAETESSPASSATGLKYVTASAMRFGQIRGVRQIWLQSFLSEHWRGGRNGPTDTPPVSPNSDIIRRDQLSKPKLDLLGTFVVYGARPSP